jgi:hypothetical protein
MAILLDALRLHEGCWTMEVFRSDGSSGRLRGWGANWTIEYRMYCTTTQGPYSLRTKAPRQGSCSTSFIFARCYMSDPSCRLLYKASLCRATQTQLLLHIESRMFYVFLTYIYHPSLHHLDDRTTRSDQHSTERAMGASTFKTHVVFISAINLLINLHF